MAGYESACSHQGLVEAAGPGPCAADPHAQQGKKQIEVDGLGDIVGCAGIETFLAIAFHRLGGDRDQRNVGNCRRIANLAHRLVSVHLRHHDIDQGDIHVGIFIQKGYAIASPLGMQHLDVVGLQHAGQRVDVADVVIDDEDLRAEQAGIVEPVVELFGDVPTFRWKGRGNQQGKLCEILRARHIRQSWLERERLHEAVPVRRVENQPRYRLTELTGNLVQRLGILLGRAAETNHDRIIGGPGKFVGICRDPPDRGHRGDTVTDRLDQRKAALRIGIGDQHPALHAHLPGMNVVEDFCQFA